MTRLSVVKQPVPPARLQIVHPRPEVPRVEGDNRWRWDPVGRRLYNDDYGISYYVAQLVRPDGSLAYECIAQGHKRSETNVIVWKGGTALGFVRIWRPTLLPPEVLTEFFGNNPSGMTNPFELRCGVEQLEIVHGITHKPGNEVREEAGLRVVEMVPFDYVKDGVPLGGPSDRLQAVLVDGSSSGMGPQEFEGIRGFELVPADQVREVETLCALTTGALWKFRNWGLKQSPGSPWRIAAQMM